MVAKGVELGTAYVTVTTETKDVAKELAQTYGKAGTAAGKAAGKNIADGLASAKGDVERASGQLAAARNKEADAVGKVRVAESRLGELRETNKASTSQLARAEEQLATALRGREVASRAAGKAAAELQDANKRAAESAGKVDIGDSITSGLGGKLSGIKEKLSAALGGVSREAGEESGSQLAGGIGDKLGEMLGGKAGIIGSTVAAAVSLAGLSAPGLLFAALNRGMQSQQAIDLTQARLGVDDLTMNKIGAAAGRAYMGAFGSSVAENTDTARLAIQSGLLDESATGQETQAVIEQLSGISTLMGEEIPAVARAAGQAIKTGIAGDATEAFDLFAAAERNGLNVSEDFLDTVNEYGTQFRKLGLSGQEAIGLINQAVQAGARDTDVAADAIKEFSIRVVDGSKSTTEAFQKLGFNADDLTARFAAGGSTARAAVGDLLGEINKIEDPVKKNEVALALFGTQFEDLGDALNQFNLDSAAASLGKVGGAAADALGQMGGNAASSIEGAKRSIEVSADQISSALAKAFGPELAKVADWVTTHQPEILGFMGKLVDGALGAADGFLGFSSTALRALATFAEGAGSAIGAVTGPLGKVTELFGKLTGNGDLANLGASVADLDNKFLGAAETARNLADGIDNSARPALDRMRGSVSSNIESAQLSAQMYRALGDAVVSMPDGHTITLTDNTPETTQRLEALGLKVTTLPNGQVIVTANTQQGQQTLDAFVQQNTGRQIPMQLQVDWSRVQAGIDNAQVRAQAQVYSPESGYVHYAKGTDERGVIPRLAGGGRAGRTLAGRLWGPGSGTSDSILGIGPNGMPTARVSAGEGVVTQDAMNRGGADIVAALNRGWTPPVEWLHSMVPGLAGGGVAGSRAIQYAQAHNGEPYVYGGLDCSGYLSGIYNALTGKSVRFTTDSDPSAYGFVKGLDAGGFSIGTNGGSGKNGHMAGTLLGTNVESDGTNGIQFGGKADGASAFPSVWHLPRELWSPPETDDPSKASGAGGLGGAGGGSVGTGGAPSGLTSSGGVSGGTSSGGAYSTAGIPEGVTPVWVVNLGSGLSSSSPGGTQQQPSSDSFAPQSASVTSPTQPAQMPDINAKLGDMGSNFLKANADQLLSDLGFRTSGGAIQALAQAVFDAMAQAAAEAVRQHSNNQGKSLVMYAGRPF
ncbi:phage tail tape measure protein [Nocardia wallacei]|uniref:phage tail tape measure protein n=1 Tax=Nocardia wallacei TaxID=480035 RepID=UPI002456BCBE|nr:phage tail tape measure protein [Nocardia wallacei]